MCSRCTSYGFLPNLWCIYKLLHVDARYLKKQRMLRPIMFALVAAVLLIASTAQAHQLPEQRKLGVGPSVDPVKCVEEHCPRLSVECVLDQECRKALECVEQCPLNWNKDPSPQKFAAQNCTNKCDFTYGQGKIFQDYLFCLASNKCISLPPIPSTCKSPNVKPVKQLSTKDFDGKWWVQRGYQKLYDCYPCQNFDFKPMNNTSWLFTSIRDIPCQQ